MHVRVSEAESDQGGLLNHHTLASNTTDRPTDRNNPTYYLTQDEFLPEDDCRKIVAACEAAVRSDAFITSQQVRDVVYAHGQSINEPQNLSFGD